MARGDVVEEDAISELAREPEHARIEGPDDDLGSPLEFDLKGAAVLASGWNFEGENAEHEEVQFDGRKCLFLRAEGTR